MDKLLRNIAIVFTGGAIGGLVTIIVATLLPATGIVEATGSHARIPMHDMWVINPVDTYRLMVWGGIFGLLFMVSTLKNLSFAKWIIIVAIVAGPYALATLFGVSLDDGSKLITSPLGLIGVIVFLALLVGIPQVMRRVWWQYGLYVGVIAGCASLFIMFPLKLGAAMIGGMAAGPTTIPWVIIFNLFYGVSTAYFIMRAKLVT
jgi:hypothetical protein